MKRNWFHRHTVRQVSRNQPTKPVGSQLPFFFGRYYHSYVIRIFYISIDCSTISAILIYAITSFDINVNIPMNYVTIYQLPLAFWQSNTAKITMKIMTANHQWAIFHSYVRLLDGTFYGTPEKDAANSSSFDLKRGYTTVVRYILWYFHFWCISYIYIHTYT